MAAALQASMEQAEAAEAAENANKQPMEEWDGEQLCRHFGESQFLSQVWPRRGMKGQNNAGTRRLLWPAGCRLSLQTGEGNSALGTPSSHCGLG